MVEEQRARVEDTMNKMLDDVDKSHLRVLQEKMYRCAAACCADKTASMMSTQRCIEACGSSLQSAQKFVQGEFNHLQDRLQRCIMTCNDSVRDKISVGANDADMSRYTREFEGCAKKCVDSHIDLVPTIMKKIKETLNKNDYLN